jgi:hypothetical protein
MVFSEKDFTVSEMKLILGVNTIKVKSLCDVLANLSTVDSRH